MNPDTPQPSREELEARLTALLLGELPAEEAAALRLAIEKDAELARLCDRLKNTIILVREAVATPAEQTTAPSAALKLSDERRQKLLAHFKTVTPKEFVPARRRARFTLVEIAAVLTIAAIFASISIPNFVRSRSTSQSNAIINNLRQLDGAKQQWALEKRKSATDVPTFEDLRPYMGRGGDGMPPSVAGETYNLGSVRDTVTADVDAARVRELSRVRIGQQLRPSSGREATVVDAEATDSRSSNPSKRGIEDTTVAPPPPPPSAIPKKEIILPKDAKSTDPFGSSVNRLAKVDPANPTSGARFYDFDGASGQAGRDVRGWGYGTGTLAPGTPAASGGSGGGGLGGSGGVAAFVETPAIIEGETRRLELREQAQSSTNRFSFELGRSRSELAAAVPSPASVPPVDPTTGLPRTAPATDEITSSATIDPTTGLPVAVEDFQRSGASANGSFALAQSQPQPNWSFSSERRLNEQSTDRLGDLEQNAKSVDSLARKSFFDSQPVGEPERDVKLAGVTTITTPKREVLSWKEDEKLGVNGDKVPVLGDLPGVGMLFRRESESDTEGKTLSKLESPKTPSAGPRSDAASGNVVNNGNLPHERYYANRDKILGGKRILQEEAVRSVDVLGFTEVPAKPVNPPVVANEEAVRRRSSSIALPPQTESGVQEKEKSGKAVSLSAAPNDTSFLFEQRLADQQRMKEKPLQVSDAREIPQTRRETETLRRYPSLSVEAAKKRVDKESQLSQPTTLSTEELKKTLPRAVAEPTLAEGDSRPNQVAQNLGELKKYSVPAAPAVPEGVRAKAQVDPKSVALLASDFAGPRNAPEARKETLKKPVEDTERHDADKAEQSQPYFEKKRELEQMVHYRDVVAMKIASENTDVLIPKSSMVEIVDVAQAQNPTVWQRIGKAMGGEAESVARIRVESDVSDINALSDRSRVRAYDPYLVQTESEVIQSKAVLDKVIDKLNLNDAWARKHGGGKKLTTDETLQLLKKKLDLGSVPNTGLMEIRVKSDKPEEAAKIANTIAEVYRDFRLEQRKQLAFGQIEISKQTLADAEVKIARAKAELERLEQTTATPQPPAQVQDEDRVIRRASTNAPIPQPEIQTCDNTFSTFSLNVSDVSFKLAAASLEKGQMPDAASVRTEEFINAFDYRDPEPPAGIPVAFAWERARYPFAHNRDLLRFSIKTAAAGRQAGRPLNLVLLLDNSGSMERADRVRIIREALRVLATQLQPQDKISVITFARTPRLWVDGVAGDKAGEIAEQVSGLTPQGGTNLEDAMNLAYQTAARHYLASGMNRVVLLTDGAANLGNVEPDALKQKVETQRKQGIALDCFGIGWEGFNDDLLEVLSRNGDGRYGFINSPEEAATEFAGQLAGALKVAASDVKVQVEFNPRRVTAYRQIGYAKHQLTKEQFRDNTVDAAEIAAQEAGNALYTVEVNPQGEGPFCVVRTRFKIPGTSDYREHEWAVPFTANAVSLEQSSPAMRLAASASAFSEWLAASPFAGEVTPDRLLGYLAGVPDIYGADVRPKKLEWMIRQAKSLEGK